MLLKTSFGYHIIKVLKKKTHHSTIKPALAEKAAEEAVKKITTHRK